MFPIKLFIGGIRPLPESGRPTGIYKQLVTTTLSLGPSGFVGDQQADLRVHGGADKAVHLYPASHYAKLAGRFPEAAEQLRVGSMGENISTAGLTEHDVRIGDIWSLGSARLQLCQPRNPCWKIDERFGCAGIAAYIAEQRLSGWYWRVLTPGTVSPDDLLTCELSDPQAYTLAAAMALWQAHRPVLVDLEKLAATAGIASHWQAKIIARIEWLRRNPDQLAPPVVRFHVKPEKP